MGPSIYHKDQVDLEGWPLNEGCADVVSAETGSTNVAPSPANRANTSAAVSDPTVARELRIAVTMNGGVSLAVYIGGVAHELDRFTREDGGGYFELLKMFGYDKTPPVIDVITGTSAGGINAAALALAQANTEGDLGLLKELWIQHGQIGDLLREPFHKGPASLLKGDDYFYPQIRSAFQRLTTNYVRAMNASPAGQMSPRPVDLTIPATLLTPVELKVNDYLRTAVVQPQHAGLFQFRGGIGDPNSVDMFSRERVKDGSGETVEALALAARASAGFPAAFEPTFIPVHHKGKAADGRPDMAPYADWVSTGKVEDLSRFAVDGGVLANTPTRPALEGIRRREVTDTMVRRILILVHPHAEYARDIENVADNALHPPTLVGALAGVARAAGSVGSRKYVEDIQQHNELALQWRDGRQAAMAQFTAAQLTDFLGENADDNRPAWQLFRKLRLRRGAYQTARNVRKQFDTRFDKLIDYAVDVMTADDAARPEGLAFLPKTPPKAEDFVYGKWQWGLNLAIGVATQASEVLKQLIDAQVKLPYHVRELAREGWRESVNGIVKLDALAAEEDKSESEPVQGAPAANESTKGYESQRIRDCLRRILEDYNKQMLPPNFAGLNARGPQAMRTLFAIVEKFLAVIKALDAEGIWVDDAAPLLRRKCPLRNVGDGDDIALRNVLLKRMLQIEIIAYLTAEHDSTDGLVPTVPIDFVQLSAHIEQHFATGFKADDKLAGMSLHRFGAFLKRSWRANDWIWGRLDAIKILMLVLLTPDMIRGYHRTYHRDGCPLEDTCPREVAEKIVRAAFHDNPSLYDKLAAVPLKKLLTKATDDVERAIGDDDAPMRNLASLVAYGFQVAAAREDVPWLARTIRDDRDDGAIGAETAQFLDMFERRENYLDGYDLLTEFAGSKIGQEAVAEQMPSDLMIRTTATAAATAVTALSAEESGLGFARPAAKAARGMVALPYWVLLALTGRGQVVRALAVILLALGVGLTALSLVTNLPGPVGKLVPAIGVASLLTVLGYAALRTQSIVHGAALLGLFIPLVSYAAVGGKADKHLDIAGGTTASLIWVVLLLVWVTVVANFASHTRSPLATGWAALRTALAFCVQNWWRLILGAGALLVVFFGRDHLVRWYRGSRLPTWITFLAHIFRRHPWDGAVCSWTTALLAVAAVAGFVIAWRKSGRFPPSRDTGSFPRMAAADPGWLATAWSSFYGLVYLAIGVSLVPLFGAGTPQPRWTRIASVASLLLGLFFSLILVNLIPYSREKRLVRRLVAHFEPKKVPKARKRIIKAFNRIDEYTDYLIVEKGERIRLTRHGKRVRRRARKISARRARVRESAGVRSAFLGPFKNAVKQSPSSASPPIAQS
jgi:patatin-related protein